MKARLPLKDYLNREIGEILSPLNVFATGEKLHRPIDPTRHEDRGDLFNHWVSSGGLERFREQFEIETGV